MNIIKIKIAIIVILGITVLSTSVAANATDLGTRPVPDTFGPMYKNTSDNYSTLFVGEITFYDTIKAHTSAYVAPVGYFQFTPAIEFAENDYKNLVYWDGLPAYAGQAIKLVLTKTQSSYMDYFVDIYDWNYR